jgi:hypothetical protein
MYCNNSINFKKNRAEQNYKVNNKS